MRFKQAIELHKNGSLIKEIWTNKFIVDNEFVWYLDFNHKKEFVVIEKWFETDFASIPRIFLPFFDKNRVSAILHDWLFTNKKVFFYDLEKNFEIRERKCWFLEANVIYYRALLTEWVSRIEAILQFLGLMVWGWICFYFFKK